MSRRTATLALIAVACLFGLSASAQKLPPKGAEPEKKPAEAKGEQAKKPEAKPKSAPRPKGPARPRVLPKPKETKLEPKAPLTLGGWEVERLMSDGAPAKLPDVDLTLPLYARPGSVRPPFGAMLFALEKETPGALKKAQYFQVLDRLIRLMAYQMRTQTDPQRRLELLSSMIFDRHGLRYRPAEVASPAGLTLSELLKRRQGGALQFVLLYLVAGRSAGLQLYPALARDELVLRLAGTRLTVVPGHEGDVRPVDYHLRRHHVKTGDLPAITQAAFLARLLARRGVLLAKSGDKKGAVRDLERVLVLVPGHKAALVELAALYDELKQPEKATRIFSALISGGHATPEVYWRRAELLIRRRHWGKAIKDLKAYLDEKDDPRAWYLIGQAEEGRGRLREAVSAYQLAAKMGDANVTALASARVRAIRGPYLLSQFRGAKRYASRVQALAELADLGDAALAPTLIAAMRVDNLRMRWQIARALRKLLGLSEEEYLELGIDPDAWKGWLAAQAARQPKKPKK